MPSYPLRENANNLQAANGRALADVTVDAATAAELTISDLQISAETLQAQADVARQAGYAQLAENLARAAELTVVPNDAVLRMYDLLRPGRSTRVQLDQLANQLETEYGAPRCAALVREASAAYERRKLFRRENA